MLIIQKNNFAIADSVMASFHNSRYVNKAHIHQFSELVYVLDGEFTVISSGRCETAKKGDVAIIQPFQPHGYFTPKGSNVKIWMLLFSNSLINDLFPGRSTYSRYKSCVFTPSDHIKNFIEARTFDTEEQKIELDEAGVRHIKSTLFPIFDEYVSRIPLLEDSKKVNSNAIAETMMYLSEHFKENVSIKDVSRAIGYSESYISRCISEAFDMNFRTLLNSVRIEHAKSLLVTKKSNAFLAGLESGFGCERSFHRAFLSVTGMTPKEYKERGRWVYLQSTIDKTSSTK